MKMYYLIKLLWTLNCCYGYDKIKSLFVNKMIITDTSTVAPTEIKFFSFKDLRGGIAPTFPLVSAFIVLIIVTGIRVKLMSPCVGVPPVQTAASHLNARDKRSWMRARAKKKKKETRCMNLDSITIVDDLTTS